MRGPLPAGDLSIREVPTKNSSETFVVQRTKAGLERGSGREVRHVPETRSQAGGRAKKVIRDQVWCSTVGPRPAGGVLEACVPEKRVTRARSGPYVSESVSELALRARSVSHSGTLWGQVRLAYGS